MTQLRLPFGQSPGTDEADFIVSEANARAVHLLEHWSTWPVRAALLVGPRKSGRTRLAHVFAGRTGGTLIDDAEEQDEEAIFHAWNRAQASGVPLLIVAAAPPPEWSIALPDLRSRLAATPVLRIGPPDDELAQALLRHGLDRHQLYAGPDVLNWLAKRADRSYVALDRIVDLLVAGAERRNVRRLTVPSVRSTLSGAGLLAGSGDTDEQDGSEDE